VAELKTRKTTASVDAFLEQLDPARRDDCVTLVRLMKQATKTEPRMWGPSIVGFGDYKYKYGSGREGEWFAMGFSPRKKDLTLYILPGVQAYKGHLEKLGPHKTGVSCLYIKRLADIDLGVLEQLVVAAAGALKTKN
jgi:Domain of unknown function (DU1801)